MTQTIVTLTPRPMTETQYAAAMRALPEVKAFLANGRSAQTGARGRKGDKCPERESRKQRVMAYLTKNGPSLSRDVADAMGWPTQTASSHLSELKKQGRIEAHRCRRLDGYVWQVKQ